MSTNLGVVGGVNELKWGGLPLYPVMDAEPEFKLSSKEYTANKSGGGAKYATQQHVLSYFKVDIVVTTEILNNLVKLQDGVSRSGTATLGNGDVLSLDCIITDELVARNGTLTLSLEGDVIKQ